MSRGTLKSLLFGAVLLVGCGETSTSTTSSGSSTSNGGHVTGGSGSTASTAGTTASTTGSTATDSSTTASTASTATNTNGSTASTASTATNTTGSTASTAGTTASTAGTATTTTGSTASTATTGTECFPDQTYVGIGNGAQCCAGVETDGYCGLPASTIGTTGSTASTTASTTGTTATTDGSTDGSTTASTTGGGTTGATCAESCYTARGYHCENGNCVLNGSSGQVQVTLEWGASMQTNGRRAREDLDLHVVEPNGCELWYGSKSCPSGGSLDLDQNPGCSDTDNNGGYGDDTENVIYPANQNSPSGTYQVIVDDYEDGCDGNTPNPFNWKLTIRTGAGTQTYNGQFHQGNADYADDEGTMAGSSDATGHKVFTFTN